MLQLPQSFAWLQDAPESFVVDIDRWIVVVVPAQTLPAAANTAIAAKIVILVMRQHPLESLRRLFRRS
jgi:hypothetical protein